MGATVLAGSSLFLGAVPATAAAIPPPLFYETVDVEAGDMAYDAGRNLIYASVRSTSALSPNSIVAINPDTAAVVRTVAAGSNPGQIDMSDDGSMLFVSLDGSASIKQFNLNDFSVVREFPTGFPGPGASAIAEDLEVMPGAPNSIAVSVAATTQSPRGLGVAIYDSGVKRPTTTASGTGNNEIEFGATAARIYG
jgi:hypothetical protein